MNAPFHIEIRRLGVLLAIATALLALLAAPAPGQGRPAESYYTAQDVQRMSDSWAARGGVLTNVPSSSYYLPQQIEAMSQGWAARSDRGDATQAKLSALSKDPLAASLIATQSSGTPSVVEFTSDSEFNWSELGIDVGIGLFLVGGLILALQFTRHQRVAH